MGRRALTDSQWAEVRLRIESSEMISYKTLGEIYGVSGEAIRKKAIKEGWQRDVVGRKRKLVAARIASKSSNASERAREAIRRARQAQAPSEAPSEPLASPCRPISEGGGPGIGDELPKVADNQSDNYDNHESKYRQSVNDAIEKAADDDVMDMETGLEVFRGVLGSLNNLPQKERATAAKLKTIAEAAMRAVDGIRVIRGLNDPEDQGSEALLENFRHLDKREMDGDSEPESKESPPPGVLTPANADG